jgi:hypothetical protein
LGRRSHPVKLKPVARDPLRPYIPGTFRSSLMI